MKIYNPFSKGRWFTVKVNGVPQRFFIEAFGSYDLSNVDDKFKDNELNESQVRNAFVEYCKQSRIIFPAHKLKNLIIADNLGDSIPRLYRTPTMVSRSIQAIGDEESNGENLTSIFLSAENYCNNMSNDVTIEYSSQSQITSIKYGETELVESYDPNGPMPPSMPPPSDWYKPAIILDGGSYICIKSTFLESTFAEISNGNTITLKIIFEDGTSINAPITSTTCYNAAFIGRFSRFQILNPQSLSAVITWNDATQLISILDSTNNHQLIENVDYTLSGDTVVILSSYLGSIFSEEWQEATFTFNFDLGQSSEITITAINQFEAGATNLIIGNFYYNNPQMVPVSFLSSYNISAIKNGDLELIKGSGSRFDTKDWREGIKSIDGRQTIYIESGYLDNYLTQSGQSITLTMEFAEANPVNFTINSAYYYTPASITFSESFDPANPTDQTTTITWNESISIVSISDGNRELIENVDYILSGDSITVLASYLSTVITQEGTALNLTFDFEQGENTTVIIRATGGIGGGGIKILG